MNLSIWLEVKRSILGLSPSHYLLFLLPTPSAVLKTTVYLFLQGKDV